MGERALSPVGKKVGSPGEAILTSPDPGQIVIHHAVLNGPAGMAIDIVPSWFRPHGTDHEVGHRGCLAASMTLQIYDSPFTQAN